MTEERLLRDAESSAHGAHRGWHAALAGGRTCERGHQQWKLLGPRAVCRALQALQGSRAARGYFYEVRILETLNPAEAAQGWCDLGTFKKTKPCG